MPLSLRTHAIVKSRHYSRHLFKGMYNLDKIKIRVSPYKYGQTTQSNVRPMSSLSQPRDIDITLPDLTQRELNYIRTQVDVILNPKIIKLAKYHENRKNSEIPANFQTANCDVTSPTNNEDNTSFINTLFPTSTKKGSFFGVNVCTHFVRSAGYPSFTINNSEGQKFKRNFYLPLPAERIVSSLKSWGATDEDLSNDPSLVLSIPDLVKYGKTADLFDIPLLEAKSLYDNSSKKSALRGNYIREKLRVLEDSLTILGLSEIIKNVTPHATKEFSTMKTANILEVDDICATLTIQELKNLSDCNLDDVTKSTERTPKSSKANLLGASDAQAIARNYYLFKNILQIVQKDGRCFKEELLVNHCFKSCPLETLILLNSYCQILKKDGGEQNTSNANFEQVLERTVNTKNELEQTNFIRKLSASAGFRKIIQFPSYAFPVSIKHKYFSDIGFTDEEINHLLRSEESFIFKSVDSQGKQLDYTNPNYINVMKERLLMLRENAAQIGLLTPSDYFHLMKNWGAFLSRVGDLAKKHSSTIKSNKSDSDIVQELQNSSCQNRSESVLSYLQDFFGNGESQKTLSYDLFQLPNYDRFSSDRSQSIKKYQIIQSLNWLKNRGFHKHDIRKSIPLLLYHPSLLEQKFEEIQEMEEFQSSQELEDTLCNPNDQSNNILQILLYLIEKEFNFSDEGTYFAEGVNEKSDSFHGYFTESLCKNILLYSGVNLKPQKMPNGDADQKEQFFGDFNYDHLASLGLEKIHFQDYVYLHDPNLNKELSYEEELLQKNLQNYSLSNRSKNDVLKRKNAVRSFSSFSNNGHISGINQKRNMSTNTPDDNKKKGISLFKLPRELVLVNPFHWIDMKLKYFGLSNTIDPNFNEAEFIKGAKQAVSTLSQLISSNEFDEMGGMLTEREYKRLRRHVETKWSDEWRNNIAFDVNNIIAVTTESVLRYQVGYDMAYVDIVLNIIAKLDTPSVPDNNPAEAKYVFITVELTKNYSPKSFGDWCISRFDVTDIKTS